MLVSLAFKLYISKSRMRPCGIVARICIMTVIADCLSYGLSSSERFRRFIVVTSAHRIVYSISPAAIVTNLQHSGHSEVRVRPVRIDIHSFQLPWPSGRSFLPLRCSPCSTDFQRRRRLRQGIYHVCTRWRPLAAAERSDYGQVGVTSLQTHKVRQTTWTDGRMTEPCSAGLCWSESSVPPG